MYNVLFSIIACLFFTILQAQDVKTASKLFDAGDIPKAKKAIDEALAGTQANLPEAWIVKHKIYWAISNSSQSKVPLTDIKLQGFTALAKAYAMPKGQEAMLKEIGINYNAPFNSYYTAFIADGSASMNEGDNGSAFNSFKAALSVSAFFNEHKMVNIPLDTMLTFYAGYTAMKNNSFNHTEYYFKKLADANASGVDLQIAYGWLSNYYLKDKKEVANAKTVCDKGLLHYPTDEYLLSVKKQIASASGNIDNVFAIYEETINKGHATFNDYLGYSSELYDYLFVNEDNHTITHADVKEKRLVEMLSKAIALKNTSAEANYIFGMYYTSKALAIDAAAKNSTDAAKKTEAKNSVKDLANTSISYLETTAKLYEAQKPLSAKSKVHYKTTLTQLINLHHFLGNAAKKTEVEKRINGL